MKRRELSATRDASYRGADSYFASFYFANSYLEAAAAGAGAADAAAAGFIAAIAGEGIAAIADACTRDLVEAFAASFACFLQRYTLEVEMFRSLAMSLACFP